MNIRTKLIFTNYVRLTMVITFFVLSFGCNKQKENDTLEKDTPYIVDFEQCMATEQEMKISEIADTVEYLELKTPKNIIITRIWDIFPIDDYLIIHTRDGIFKFTRKGEYIKQIGHVGQGPGEYSLIFNVDIDHINKEIILSDPGKLLFYDLDGNYLRMEKTETLFRIGLSDSILWVSEMANQKCQYIAYALNSQRDTIASILNPHYGMKSQDEGTGFSLAKLFKPFYRYKDTLYLKGKEVNDTIYRLSGRNSIPYTIINMGKYKLPVEYEAWYSYEALNKNGAHYWGIPSVAEDEYYLYLLAQRRATIDRNNYAHNEDNFRYIIFDKRKKTGFVAKTPKESKLHDDILGGPSIWPYWVTDDYYMNVVEWCDLSDEIKNGNYILAPALEKQFAGFGFGTNELIVLCRRKK